MQADTIAAGISSAFRSGVPSRVRIALRLINPGLVATQAWYDMGAKLSLVIARNILEATLVAATDIEDPKDEGYVPVAARNKIRAALDCLSEAYGEVSGTQWSGKGWLGPMEI